MAAGTTPIEPLSNSQKLFLQRLMVKHVLTDEHAKQLYASIKKGFAHVAPPQNEEDDEEDEEGGGGGGNNIDHGYMGTDLNHVLGIINASLVPAFNLEVCTVSLPPPYNPDNDNDTAQLSTGGRKRAAMVKYHAIVNRSNDAIAQSHAFPLSKGGPHEMAYFRLALEKIVECGVELLEEGNSNSGSAVGCPGAMNRMDLINLRTEMEGNHRDKLTIAQAEGALELLESEGWLVRAAPPADDDDDEDMDEDDEEEGGRSSKRKRRRKPSRKSLKGTFYGIGPRSFMELGDFLQKAGLPGDRMPQSILHRV
mmetsp:Transcript_21384/g.46434  ORF Transcript_21384/g.46434 Transcript_21384/m.46434 type:complete len:309 (+) Transcript_21384:109-1035(+)|eukprot:CAMPEP_0172300884 /NCGR_PEP_ID=MMETSP1058-20130122/2888_1 /TAXON_ID=83371 /ORGANISM="Detonula confervacea, Strain CCMP 353" /LENGTH=308 /DNA_ID=CAMNT_0013010819 /DNA_START=18 /DNA_END=944 /DNA_ORIENTATION=+